MFDRSRLRTLGVLTKSTRLKGSRGNFPRIEDPTPAEEECVYMRRSHMITNADLTKAGGWTPGCRKCKALKKGDHSSTDLAHSADCRARVVEILADDIAFRTRMKKAMGRKEGARRMKPRPKVQMGSSTSSRCAPVDLTAHLCPQNKDVGMDNADIEILLSDGAHATAKASTLPSISVTGTLGGAEMVTKTFQDGQVAKVPATTFLGVKRGRSDSSRSTSSSSSTSKENDQKNQWSRRRGHAHEPPSVD